MHGKYNDYSPDWYTDIGEIIVMSMLINCFIPIIELVIETVITNLGICCDQKCICCRCGKSKKEARYITKTKQVWAYLEIHNGPE